MRIWDVDPRLLCRSHLLGEHRELHALWVILTEDRRGYQRHPETVRWRGKLAALYQRHALLTTEMAARGYRHRSPLDPAQATGAVVQDEYVDSHAEQMALLSAKPCPCPLDRAG
ncbi:MAG TPA: pyrimidine dimer DNA glycosylase/endonuclease V [Gaiellales bacterium]|jgi:hypothetical protein|nr:pyrimidine dimer DNA glycosylase/endonuclease V [Gaiellales bacterium]